MNESPEPVCWSNPEAVATCVEANRAGLLAFIERRMSPGLRQRLDPDDIVQEVSLAAVRKPEAAFKSHEQIPDPFAWLCHVAEQRIIDAHRRHFGAAKRDAAREVSIDAPPRALDPESGGMAAMIAVSMTTPSQALSRDAKQGRLRHAIADLPEEQREAIRLRYVDALTTKEIAARLGKSDVSVRVMLSRTVQRLQKLLDSPR